MKSTVKHLEPGRPAREGQLILERRYRIAKAIGGLSRWKTILDVGCGNGAQTRYFKDPNREVIGLDFIPLNRTEGSGLQDGFKFVRGSAQSLPFSNGSFNAVISFEVLEHVEDDSRMIEELFRVLEPGGMLLLSVPNKWWIFETHGGSVRGFNWLPWNRVPLFGWLPKPLHDKLAHARIYTRKSVERLLIHAGFSAIESGYITAPLDVMSDGRLRASLRKYIFRNDITRIPFLAVNLYVVCTKEL